MAEAAVSLATSSVDLSGVFFPHSPADFTPANLNTLPCFDGARISAVALEPLGEGVGVVGQLARLKPTYDGDAGRAPKSIVAKYPSANEMTRHLVRQFKFYEREVAFYRNLSGRIALASPQLLHAAHDPGTDDFLLLLEDLGDRRYIDQLDGCSAKDAMLAIREVAALHAEWWESPKLNALEWMPLGDSELTKAGLTLYPIAWPIFLERFGSCLPDGFKSIGERLSEQIVGMLDRFRDRPRTICHGDFRLDNLFLGSRPEHRALTAVDWQIAIRSTGTYDVGYFVSQSFAPAVRREIEIDLLRAYHDRLVELGVRHYSFADCIDDYRWTQIFCFCYPVIGGGLGDLANERGMALGRTITERSVASIEHWKADEFLN